MKRRAVSSLSPAKQRHVLAYKHPHGGSSGHLQNLPRPPLTVNGSATSVTNNTCNLAAGARPPTKLPPLPRRSVAVSQEETCLVSAAGDVLVCRSREFSQLVGDPSGNHISDGDSIATSNAALRWCDLECSEFPMTLEKPSLCNPWLTRSNTQREENKKDDLTSSQRSRINGGSGGLCGGGGSSYQWQPEANNPLEQTNRAFGQLELEVANSVSKVTSSPTASPRFPHSFDGGDDDDRVLSMPSFDYSHFGNGGNDMLPVSPIRARPSRLSDSAEIDVNLSLLKFSTNGSAIERQLSRSFPSASSLPLSRTFPAIAQSPTTIQSTSNTPVYHGVPTFLTSISQVRIRQVSAHPRGSHVLMISAEALLFSYGLNDHGQLGIGIKSPAPSKCTESHQQYVWTPTVITPLLENGGKAITCAAGESHSLVVVSTEGRRILKSRSPRNDPSRRGLPVSESPVAIQMNRVSSSPPTIDVGKNNHGYESEHSSASTSTASESVWHHQLYGFGRNNFMKIGLVHPRRKIDLDQPMRPKSTPMPDDTQLTDQNDQDEMEDVLLPHRVALHCTVWPEKVPPADDLETNGTGCLRLPPQGIFALAASSEHSAALVRRATGGIELYTWGNAAYHALGVTPTRTPKSNCSTRIAPLPTLVKQLSYSATQDREPPKIAKNLLEQNPPEYPVEVSLGPYSSFVVTSKGRCFSFGISYDGMLGQGRGVADSHEPELILFPESNGDASQITIASVSAGTGHVIALAKSGAVFTWGKNADGRLGLPNTPILTPLDDVTTNDSERAIEWTPQKLPLLSKAVAASLTPRFPNSGRARRNSFCSGDEYGPVVQVCAGLDCSIFVTACGKVLSCGKKSGRLGLGEAHADVPTPTPLFGGLSLWHKPAAAGPSCRDNASPSHAKSRPVLKRGITAAL